MSETQPERPRSAGAPPGQAGGREPATAIVLAGGGSTRMGARKSLLPFRGKPLIQHVCQQLSPRFDEILISANDPRELSFLNVPVVRDEVPGQGPLRAIISCLAVSHHDLNFVIACDIPWVDAALLERLQRETPGCDCVVPITDAGHYEPLFAFYRKSVLPAMRQTIEAGERRVTAAFSRCRVTTVAILAPCEIVNVNTLEDYRILLRNADADPHQTGGADDVQGTASASHCRQEVS